MENKATLHMTPWQSVKHGLLIFFRWFLIIFFAAYTLFPLLWLVISSFKTNYELLTDPFSLPRVADWQLYKRAGCRRAWADADKLRCRRPRRNGAERHYRQYERLLHFPLPLQGAREVLRAVPGRYTHPPERPHGAVLCHHK